MSPQQVQGIDVLTVEPSTAVSPQYGAYQIKTTYGEVCFEHTACKLKTLR